jgi:SAM-dependent methyltransferase
MENPGVCNRGPEALEPSRVFDYCGIASLDDLDTPLWRSIFSHLETIQDEFIGVRPHVPDYPWPRNPLHNCTRVWEYPFIYHHLQAQTDGVPDSPLPSVVDLGSGATFFPFAVAQLGRRVIAVDADPRAKSSMDRAIGKVSSGIGSVTSLLSDARSIALDTESVDSVYCISVLEHIPDFERVISEAARILRPNGLFVLTFDLDLRGNFELGPAAYGRLMNTLQVHFSPVYSEKIVHPLRILNSDNSIYPMYPNKSSSYLLLQPLKRVVRSAYNKLHGRPELQGRLLVSTYGACLRKPMSRAE